MLWPLGSIYALLVVFAVVGAGCESQMSPDPNNDEPFQRRGTIVKASELNHELLARFKVPGKSTASDTNPLRIEAELVRAGARPPYMLRGYLLVPIEARKQPPSDAPNAEEYVKIPFGQLDVVAPHRVKEPFLLFPYEHADAVRKRLNPGDIVLVGMEAVSLAGDGGKAEKLDVELKVNRIISW